MIPVSVVVAMPDREEVVELQVEEGTSVAGALARSGLAARFPEIDFAAARVGIWSRPCARETVLREGDRVEVYRELTADPKEMRRVRARRKPTP
ncbi:MAG: RnfH family protein [Usitatibacter sp.]